MALWRNFENAILTSIFNGSRCFLYVFRDHLLEVSGRTLKRSHALARRGPPTPLAHKCMASFFRPAGFQVLVF